MLEPRKSNPWWKALLMAGALALPSVAAAAPPPGANLPAFKGEDLLGQEHESREYEGKRTMLVAITDKHAGDEMQRWFEAADSQAPESVQRESIISLHVPFFVSIGAVRGRVKPQVPRQYWDDTLLDRDGDLAETLGLASSRQPYVFALDEHGRVLAAVHGPADSPEAASIWLSLTGTQGMDSPSLPGRSTSPQGGSHTPGDK
jgi:hypothetical protein